MDDIKLYDIGVANKVPVASSRITLVTPGDNNTFNIALDVGKSIIAIKGSMSERRKELSHDALGADFYIDIDKSLEEERDELRSWATVFSKTKDGYVIKSKNYFILRVPSEFDRKRMSHEEQQIMNKLILNGQLVYTTDEPMSVTFTKPDGPCNPGCLLDRADLELLLKDGLSKMLFKNRIDVFNQNGDKFYDIDIDDVLDTPKTYVSDKATSKTKVPAKKMHLFYEYDAREPLYLLPDCLMNCPVVEFTFDHFDDNNRLVWRKSDKIVQNQHGEEYDYSLREKGNRSFLALDGPHIQEILDELGDSGLIQEFEVFDDPSNKPGYSYYVANQYINKKTKEK